MTKWIRGLAGRSTRPPQTGDRPARPYGISAGPGGCVVIVKDPQVAAGSQPGNGTEKQITAICRREPNPQYGIADRIAVALFPILRGWPDRAVPDRAVPDREAGE